MTFSSFVRNFSTDEKTSTVLNLTVPEPVRRMLEDVLLTDERRGIVVVSDYDHVSRTVLGINSNTYVTGCRTLENVAPPEVVARLDETHVREELPEPEEPEIAPRRDVETR